MWKKKKKKKKKKIYIYIYIDKYINKMIFLFLPQNRYYSFCTIINLPCFKTSFARIIVEINVQDIEFNAKLYFGIKFYHFYD
jgi:hypothetical protein